MYKDRVEAGEKLGRALKKYEGKDTVVLALPRGGIVLGAEVAKQLKAQLDVVLVRKIGHPFSPEFAIGAVVLGEEPVFNEGEKSMLDERWLKNAIKLEQQKNQKRKEMYYAGDIEPASLKNRTVIIVDDGIATGLTMRAAVLAAKNHRPKKVIVAIPVAPPDSVEMLQELADDVVVLDNPESFVGSVGAHYHEFEQVEDDEVKSLLSRHHNPKNKAGNRDS